MPPHCDSLDGPVVLAAIRALEAGDVDLVLPYVHADGADEVRRAFDLVVVGRQQGDEARQACDRYFFETVVRIHRAGEGAPFTGLKPAGLDNGPVPRDLRDQRGDVPRFVVVLLAGAGMGWGIAVAIHAATLVINGRLGSEWEERKIRELIARDEHEIPRAPRLPEWTRV